MIEIKKLSKSNKLLAKIVNQAPSLVLDVSKLTIEVSQPSFKVKWCLNLINQNFSNILIHLGSIIIMIV